MRMGKDNTALGMPACFEQTGGDTVVPIQTLMGEVVNPYDIAVKLFQYRGGHTSVKTADDGMRQFCELTVIRPFRHKKPPIASLYVL